MPRTAKPQIVSLATYAGAYLTPRQLAEWFGFHPMTVLRWCRSGKLQAGKVGHDWRIPVAAAREMEAQLYQPRKTA